jgi:putative FmdB family regulatory protein
MPIYEYICRDCQHEFEVLVRGTNSEELVCPECGCYKLTKKLSVPAAPAIAGSAPACAIKEAGACGATNCCGGGCGMSQWMK